MTKITVFQQDIPKDLTFNTAIAVDTETMGLNHSRDRLCVVQICGGDDNVYLIQIIKDQTQAPNLKQQLENNGLIFHYGRFDIGILKQALDIDCKKTFCTKIASKLVRTYTDKHGLKHLCRELLGIEVDKGQQSSDWGAETLSEDQKKYAAGDVLYLHQLKQKLTEMLIREGRMALAQACFDFLPHRVDLDLNHFSSDIFSHHA